MVWVYWWESLHINWTELQKNSGFWTQSSTTQLNENNEFSLYHAAVYKTRIKSHRLSKLKQKQNESLIIMLVKKYKICGRNLSYPMFMITAL